MSVGFEPATPIEVSRAQKQHNAISCCYWSIMRRLAQDLCSICKGCRSPALPEETAEKRLTIAYQPSTDAPPPSFPSAHAQSKGASHTSKRDESGKATASASKRKRPRLSDVQQTTGSQAKGIDRRVIEPQEAFAITLLISTESSRDRGAARTEVRSLFLSCSC